MVLRTHQFFWRIIFMQTKFKEGRGRAWERGYTVTTTHSKRIFTKDIAILRAIVRLIERAQHNMHNEVVLF